MSAATSSCPVGCGREQKPGKLLCLPCWREVPAYLQREVNRTWRAVQRRDGATLLERQDVLRAYRQAREAAIASVA